VRPVLILRFDVTDDAEAALADAAAAHVGYAVLRGFREERIVWMLDFGVGQEAVMHRAIILLEIAREKRSSDSADDNSIAAADGLLDNPHCVRDVEGEDG
jgi:hypothetical protein